jgi:hypothetical protein
MKCSGRICSVPRPVLFHWKDTLGSFSILTNNAISLAPCLCEEPEAISRTFPVNSRKNSPTACITSATFRNRWLGGVTSSLGTNVTKDLYNHAYCFRCLINKLDKSSTNNFSGITVPSANWTWGRPSMPLGTKGIMTPQQRRLPWDTIGM